ncbi:hypothetical protein IW492_10455 [Enterococcus sp. BWB1-3]|uniref:hypothetical protein n=1 Tax=Enterococcus sp. BWB1-3 TaxID=2787713 RepID=UPI001923C73C|nr:hypothetical protein [Enterococcus sp. BWB1-3]MBL1229650.1 hypothetical protein [Enterococcus sp. BWB1-3]
MSWTEGFYPELITKIEEVDKKINSQLKLLQERLKEKEAMIKVLSGDLKVFSSCCICRTDSVLHAEL